jgi:exodeoxyribonuclease VII small subunit
MSKRKKTYASSMEELQNIISEIQTEKVGMDDLTEKVKRAAELIQFCKEKLRKTETELGEVLGT